MPGCPCDGSPLLLVMSECSGHADRNRTSVDTADFCSYLSDCTSPPAHHHLLHGLCWLAWCSRRTCGVWARSKPRRMRGCSSRHRSCKRAVAAHQARASRAPRAARSCWRAWAVNRRTHGHGTRQPAMAVKGWLCRSCGALSGCSRANGAARCIAAALMLMQAARLSPEWTETAAEPTASPLSAAVSTDIDENGRVCFDGLRPCALLL